MGPPVLPRSGWHLYHLPWDPVHPGNARAPWPALRPARGSAPALPRRPPPPARAASSPAACIGNKNRSAPHAELSLCARLAAVGHACAEESRLTKSGSHTACSREQVWALLAIIIGSVLTTTWCVMSHHKLGHDDLHACEHGRVRRHSAQAPAAAVGAHCSDAYSCRCSWRSRSASASSARSAATCGPRPCGGARRA